MLELRVLGAVDSLMTTLVSRGLTQLGWAGMSEAPAATAGTGCGQLSRVGYLRSNPVATLLSCTLLPTLRRLSSAILSTQGFEDPSLQSSHPTLQSPLPVTGVYRSPLKPA